LACCWLRLYWPQPCIPCCQSSRSICSISRDIQTMPGKTISPLLHRRGARSFLYKVGVLHKIGQTITIQAIYKDDTLCYTSVRLSDKIRRDCSGGDVVSSTEQSLAVLRVRLRSLFAVVSQGGVLWLAGKKNWPCYFVNLA
jgi:hypothetical protein